jgi:hypothetical protein
MPGRHTKEDYARHYRDYQGKPEQIKKRAQRNAARAEMVKKHGKAALAGKDVDHKKRIKHGGSNSASNLRVQSRSTNRGRT